MEIYGTITTEHNSPDCVAQAISTDNLMSMETHSADGVVKTTIKGIKIRSVIASVDDYLLNLTVAEDLCR